MERDLTELARICLQHARNAKARKVAAALLRMAKDYQRRAALLRGADQGVGRGRRARPTVLAVALT
jgi:hypothetical protein